MTVSNKELRRRGYPQADLDLAEKQREAERRAGGKPRTIEAVLYGRPAKARPDAPFSELTDRQLRGRGGIGQIAIQTDHAALAERDPERATAIRQVSGMLKALACVPTQLEFNFFMGGNVSTGYEFHDTIRDRLMASGATAAERFAARAVLVEIIRWLGWQSYACDKTAAEIGDILGIDAGDMAHTLKRLESVGAITRVKRGRTKTITVTPEGAYRGDILRHAEAVARYSAEVVPLRQPKPSGEPPSAA